MVSALVGTERKRYNIHKDILIAKSEYFKAMFTTASNWEENKSNEVTWSDDYADDSSKVIGIWVNWLYGCPINTVDIHWKVLVYCYKLGHVRLMPHFCNDVCDAIRRLHVQNNWHSNLDILQLCHKQDLRGTPLYQIRLKSSVHTMMTLKNLASAERLNLVGIAYTKL